MHSLDFEEFMRAIGFGSQAMGYIKEYFNKVEKGATARKYANSLEWFRDANLLRFCHNVSIY